MRVNGETKGGDKWKVKRQKREENGGGGWGGERVMVCEKRMSGR